MSEEHDYEAGLREGRLKALEVAHKGHGARLDDHNKRIGAQERITYSLLGAIALLEILPTIKDMVSGG